MSPRQTFGIKLRHTMEDKTHRTIANFYGWEITWQTEDGIYFGYHYLHHPRGKQTYPTQMPDYLNDRDSLFSIIENSLDGAGKLNFMSRLAEGLGISPWGKKKNYFNWQASFADCWALVSASDAQIATALAATVE